MSAYYTENKLCKYINMIINIFKYYIGERVCVRACVRAGVRAGGRAGVRAGVRVCACVHA